MDFTFENHSKAAWDKIFQDDVIDLSKVTYLDPWTIALVCLKAVETRSKYKNPSIILPDSASTIPYLKMMQLDAFLKSLSYEDRYFKDFDALDMGTLPIQEIVHCRYRDEFNARLSGKVRKMLQDFGLRRSDEQKVTGLIGELGNNVFDHNEGSWPTDFGGAIIVGQNYSGNFLGKKMLRFVVADPGVGFRGSFGGHDPKPQTDLAALKLGLSGVTGRTGEKRGNGLKLIQQWTIKDFSGEVRIHTGNALTRLSRAPAREELTRPIMGTIAELVIKYR